jgi:hypothetical protein
MRQHGVPNFPDPSVSHNGNQTSIRQVISKPLVSSPQFHTAQTACASLMPGGGPGGGRSPAEQHARAQHLLAFARCMRSHSVSTFPDPTAQGQLTLEMVHAAGIDLQAPAVQHAAYTCVPAAGGAITAADVHRALNGGG